MKKRLCGYVMLTMATVAFILWATSNSKKYSLTFFAMKSPLKERKA